jgi:predicted O-methyltransferase YrrM
MIEPDFNRDRFEGQMSPNERVVLYAAIMDRQCKNVWEVGTCRGGGSTYYIATALENLNDGGMLYTVDDTKEFYDYAQALYGEKGALNYLRHRVCFNFGNALKVFPTLLANKSIKNPDAVLLDGEDDSIECLYQFCMFRPYLGIGALAIFHDWNCGKTNYVRPTIVNDVDWKQIAEEASIAVFEKIGTLHDQTGVRI